MIWCQERGICDRVIHEGFFLFHMVWLAVDQIHFLFHWTYHKVIGRQIDFSTSLLAPPHLSVFECCCVIPSLCISGSVSCASNNLHYCWLHSFWGWGTSRVWASEVMILQVSDSPSQVTVLVGSIWWTQDWSHRETKGKLAQICLKASWRGEYYLSLSVLRWLEIVLFK